MFNQRSQKMEYQKKNPKKKSAFEALKICKVTENTACNRKSLKYIPLKTGRN